MSLATVVLYTYSYVISITTTILLYERCQTSQFSWDVPIFSPKIKCPNRDNAIHGLLHVLSEISFFSFKFLIDTNNFIEIQISIFVSYIQLR